MRTIEQIKRELGRWQESWNWLLFSICLRAMGNHRAGELQPQRIPASAHRRNRAHVHYLLLATGLLLAQSARAWHFSGVVWYDNNQDSIRQTGETGVSGVTVQVRNCTNNTLVASTTTASDGSFSFTDTVVPLSGDYHVAFTNLPAGYVFTHQIYPPPTNGSVVSTVDPATGYAPCFIFNQQTNSTLNNAGILRATNTTATALTSLARCVGDSATFSTTVSGTGPFTYLWRKDGVLLAGKTTNSLVIAPIASTNAGVYSVIVKGFLNSVTNSATLTVNTNVSATQLTSLTKVAGSSAAFSTIASGTGPFSYAWFKDGLLIASQTTNTLTIASVVPTNAGTYWVVVSGACHSVTNSATLTVNTPTSASALSDVTQCIGGSATFSVLASGTGPFTYAWFKDGALLSGQTTNSLTIAPVNATNAGFYAVAVTGAANSVTNSAHLVVNTPVSATPLMNLTNVAGSSATFSTVASGTGPFSYIWFKDGILIAGQTTNSLIIQSVAPTNAGLYSVVVSGACLSVTNSARLIVNLPTVASALSDITRCAGDNATFSIMVSGTGPFTYVWFKDGTVLSGQATNSLNIVSVNATNAGLYTVVVTGTANSVTNSAHLTVNTPVSATPLANLTNVVGDAATFSTVASGTGPFGYLWFKDGALLTGQTTNCLTIPNVATTNAGTYSVVVIGACGSVTNSATLTVNVATRATPLSDVTQCVGGNASFNLLASGTGPFTYTWFKDGTLLPGQTNSSFTIAPVNATNAGVYAVVVSGMVNSVTNSATLTVNTPVSATPMAGLVRCQGDSATFTTVASGTGPFIYAWLKDGVLIAGQTTNSLTIPSVTATNMGTYTVEVTGACTTVTNSATLTVNSPTTAGPLTSVIKNAGASAAFQTTAADTGPFYYVWRKDGALIAGQTTNSLTISPVNAGNAGSYSVEVSGACNTVTNQATLTLNQPPTVSIISPTNGATFIALANLTILANAQDVDGTISKVEFFQGGTNKIGETTASSPPYFTLFTNVPPGAYTLTAIATDNLGATGTSAPVNITVVDQPPVIVTGSPKFNPQTDMFEQPVRVINPTYYMYASARLLISNLPAGVQVYNASGATNGIPFVQSLTSIAPGGSVDFVVEFFVPNRVAPQPAYSVQLVAPMNASNALGPSQPINRVLPLPSQAMLVEFNSITNRVYYVQYSADMKDWKTSVPAITGIGGILDWIDNGQPKTESAPATQVRRYYRVILLP